MDTLDELRIRQLDQELARFRKLTRHEPPQGGWLKAIREALGMSIRQMAERAGLSNTSVVSAEASEARGTVQLNSLQRLAEAMDCRLVYAVVPNESLRHAIEEQAERRAARLVEQVSDSMELEDQGISRDERRRQVRDLAAEILRSRGRDFWDV